MTRNGDSGGLNLWSAERERVRGQQQQPQRQGNAGSTSAGARVHRNDFKASLAQASASIYHMSTYWAEPSTICVEKL